MPRLFRTELSCVSTAQQDTRSRAANQRRTRPRPAGVRQYASPGFEAPINRAEHHIGLVQDPVEASRGVLDPAVVVAEAPVEPFDQRTKMPDRSLAPANTGDAASGLTIEGRARTPLVHSDEYEEWNVNGLARIDPGASGRGLSLGVRPAWSETSSGVRQLVETAAAAGVAPA